MKNPNKNQVEACKSTTRKLDHVRLNTFRFGSWVIVKCPNPNGTFNFSARLGNAMSLNLDGTEAEFVARLEACGTR